MKSVFILLTAFFFSFSQPSPNNIYVCRNLNTALYSEAPIENIQAASSKGFSVLNLTTAEVQFNIPIRSFQFKKSLMQEHFNENYMESDTYPSAKFKGKLDQVISTDKNGDYTVTVTGELEVHGVKRQRTINGTLHVENKNISISSKFDVLCKDHHIKIPRLVFKNIAESIQVTVSGAYTPYSSPQS